MTFNLFVIELIGIFAEIISESFVAVPDQLGAFGVNHWQECSVCGYKKDITAHSWSNWTLKTEPTLTTTGTAEHTCDCGEKQTKTDVPALTDTIWTKSNRTDPTLDGTGSEDYTSTDYGKVTITIPALSDKTVWTNTSHKDVTEEAEGEDVYESTDYGTVTVILPRLDHTHVWGDWEITKAPTLSEEGTAKRVCTLNNTHIDTKTLPVLTDTSVWTKDDTQHVDPTEDNDGKDVYTSEYGEVIYPLDKLPHTHKFPLTFVPEVKPTEDKEGVKEHWHCDGCGKDFEDEDGTKEVTADDLKIGKLKKEVQSGENAPAATLTTPNYELVNAVLTEEEQAFINDGKDIKIVLKIDVQDEPAAEDKTAVETAIGGLKNYKLGQYLDVNLFKVIDGVQNPVTETTTAITITIEVPSALRGSGRTYSVIRVHDGETTVLDDQDSDPNTVTIKTDKFSTYALAYSENKNDTPPDESNSGSTDIPSLGEPTNSGYIPSESSGSSDNDTTSPSDENSLTDDSGINSSDGTTSSDENNSAPSESAPADNNGNPSTGIAVSLVPLAAALAVVTITVKRKKK